MRTLILAGLALVLLWPAAARTMAAAAIEKAGLSGPVTYERGGGLEGPARPARRAAPTAARS